jgi:hypothetical protein
VPYGGIERIVDMLDPGLTDTLANMWHVSSAIRRGGFDVGTVSPGSPTWRFCCRGAFQRS